LAFLKVFGSENYRLALSGEKHLATVFAVLIEMSKIGWVIWVISKPCNGKTVNSGERAHL